MAVRSSIRTILVACCAVAILLGGITTYRHSHSLGPVTRNGYLSLDDDQFEQDSGSGNSLRVWLFESWGTHDEVFAALINAFGKQPHVQLSLFLQLRRYGIDDILAQLGLHEAATLERDYNDFSKFAGAAKAPHFLVSTTCDADVDNLADGMRHLLHNSQAHLFCVIHHANWYKEGPADSPLLREWVEQGRVDFVALSPHTAEYLQRRVLPTWNLKDNATVRIFPPVFPVARETDNNLDDMFLAIQGDYSAERRSYGRIFQVLENITQTINEDVPEREKKSVSLHLIGHGPLPEVPQSVRDQVYFDSELDYPDFYRLLSRAYAVITAFANDDYLHMKASSTVPASLIAGVPIVASEEVLSAYSYLRRDAVWLSREGETELDTLSRIGFDLELYLSKRAVVRQLCSRLIQDNIHDVGQWMQEAKKRRSTDTTSSYGS